MCQGPLWVAVVGGKQSVASSRADELVGRYCSKPFLAPVVTREKLLYHLRVGHQRQIEIRQLQLADAELVSFPCDFIDRKAGDFFID